MASSSMRKVGLAFLLVIALLGPTQQAFAGEWLDIAKDTWNGIKQDTIGGGWGVKAYDIYTSVAEGKTGQVASAAWKGGALGVVIVLASWLIDYAVKINPFEGDQASNVAPAIRAAGAFIIGLINIFYILVLLFIAISTILGVERYSLQALLPRLVIAILLTNFGIFFVYAIAQLSQLLAQGLLGPHIGTDIINATGIDGKLLYTGARLAGETLVAALTGGAFGLLIPIIEVFILLLDPQFWFALLLLVTALILIFRIAGLWVLAIFAPAGVAAGVLPSTQRFSAMYWQKVLAYAFVAPVLIFFIRLAVIIFGATKGGEGIAGLFGYLVTAFTLLIGIMVTRKMGVEIANFIIGAFEKGVKSIVGATVAYAKLLYAIGKTGGQAALAASTGGTSLGASFATKMGMNATQAKALGTVAGDFSGNLKGQFGDKGIMGSVGKFFGKRSKELKEFEPKEKEWANDQDKKSADTQAAASGRDELLQKEPELAKTIANRSDYDARMYAATSELEKAAIALAFANSGGLTNDNFTDRVDRWVKNPDLVNQIRREGAVRGDMRLATPNWTALTSDEKVKKAQDWIKSGNPLKYQNRPALQDAHVAEALAKQFEKTPDKLDSQLSRSQKQWLGFGMKKAIDRQPDAEKPRMVLRAAALGADPRSIYRTAGFQGLSRSAQVQIQNTINNSPKYYNNQDATAAVSMISKVRDPSKAVNIMNNKNMAPEVKAAIAAEVQRGAASVLAPEMRRVLKANMRIAQERAAQAMETLLQEVKSEAIKAGQAAKKAGDIAAERS